VNRAGNPIAAVHALGQSLWLDDLRREMIDSGELRSRIAAGQIRGMTSNPTIFEQAISGGEVYSRSLRPLAQAGWSADRILDALMIEDVREAADLFRPVYEASEGGDGFVSLEVHPALADETEATLLEARRLWTALNRPNVMVKIPATRAGIPAIRQATAEGINVNITLIFSLKRYAEVIEAYLAGLEERRARNGALDHVASVASFFVSRVDTAVDGRLEKLIRQEGPQAERAAALLGQAAIANAQLAYAQFRAAFASDRFRALQGNGARLQRPLWASTSTKNPAYPDTYYLDHLVGPQTVNTVPLATLEAFDDHGRPSAALGEGLSSARSRLEALSSIGVSMDEVTDELERQGVKKFHDSFVSLLKTVESRAAAAQREVAAIQPRLQATLEQFDREEVGRRLWARDSTLWPGDADGWLGWLDLPEKIPASRQEIDDFAHQARQDGFTDVVLLGMGGSSLAARVLGAWGAAGAGLNLTVLDTVEPAHVRQVAEAVDRPLFIVASKSGSTVEPLSLLEHFWEAQSRQGSAFVAITDPGSRLERLAAERGFRRIFRGPVDVGGRFSALSVFGVVPAGLAGVDLVALAEGASSMARRSGPNVDAARNPGVFLGAMLAAAQAEGRDKITFVADPPCESLLAWIEQLLAESTGKEGRGLFPVVGEPPAAAARYGADRVIVYLRAEGDHDDHVSKWVKAGLPTAIVSVGGGIEGIGAEFLRWEVATAVACHAMGVNAFDQPDVERAKEAARRALRPGPGRPGTGPETKRDESIARGVARQAVESVHVGDAFVVVAFTPETASAVRSLGALRRQVRDRLGNATLVGFGPRYLHSTGQLFKGGPDGLVTLILYAPSGEEIEVPGAGFGLGELLRAQALGDFEAMRALGRRVFFVALDSPRQLADLGKAVAVAAEAAKKGTRTA
jgi:transaldolase/glucose-6-phosphate isomerase